MSTLDLKLGYIQLAINPKDMEKTTFITRNDTFAFLRMPFGLSGAASKFQKTIDIILKPVLGGFVMCYMDNVIITSPSFSENLDHLNQVFTSLQDAALNSREQLIREQPEDPELGHIYRYLENSDDSSTNATVCKGWSHDFKLFDGLLYYAKDSTFLEELRVYIPQSLREAIMQEFHDLL
ncbi:retrovirus-related Pol polyprotein from transposon 297 [Trichonephila clavipes]|nr:retrovirus-related Pol polyprotein from transposon 297 [Trichonephila clavipes]